MYGYTTISDVFYCTIKVKKLLNSNYDLTVSIWLSYMKLTIIYIIVPSVFSSHYSWVGCWGRALRHLLHRVLSEAIIFTISNWILKHDQQRQYYPTISFKGLHTEGTNKDRQKD
ncbi:Hypothetical predicted protein [Octopus vulgaris]|uniref:Uncharacterized protein n=1 Tax=Octopus vulgaris TaxID=6645 RepID=A0AA36FA84_OCTVU|nr:Hypothetical predicted protein [Octopus vulgaris]